MGIKNAISVTVIAIIFSGCATIPEDSAGRASADGYKARIIVYGDNIADGIVFEPVYKTRLDLLRESAGLANNRLTAEVAAGTAAAVTAYIAADACCKSLNIKPNFIVSMAATAGSAYAAAAIAGFVYDMLAARKAKKNAG
ncbi:MAG TPA: hypothetical protein P5511_02375 [Candidatus Goldiibacteriota bacterium]|nr:hypothetical protein [Candidatus Goldiibacteriota bacterium]